MDDIEKRLREVSDTCVKSYLEWAAKKKDLDARETLQDAIHELRKVSARLEIEIAVSEREDMVARPIPIPPHRSTRKRGDDEDSNGNNTGNFNDDDGGPQGTPRQASGSVRHGMRRRPQGGGGGGGNNNRGNSE